MCGLPEGAQTTGIGGLEDDGRRVQWNVFANCPRYNSLATNSSTLIYNLFDSEQERTDNGRHTQTEHAEKW